TPRHSPFSSANASVSSASSPNSSQYSFRYRGVWKKVAPWSASTIAIQSRRRKSRASSESEMRIDSAVEDEQGVRIRLQRRPYRAIRLGVHERDVVPLEHVRPLARGPERERTGHAMA